MAIKVNHKGEGWKLLLRFSSATLTSTEPNVTISLTFQKNFLCFSLVAAVDADTNRPLITFFRSSFSHFLAFLAMSPKFPPPPSLSLSLLHTHAHTQSTLQSPFLSFFLSLSHILAHANTLTLTPTHPHTHTLSLIHDHTHTLSISLSLNLSISLAHTQTHSCSLSQSLDLNYVSLSLISRLQNSLILVE